MAFPFVEIEVCDVVQQKQVFLLGQNEGEPMSESGEKLDNLITEIAAQVKKDFQCAYCGATRRGNVHGSPPKEGEREVSIGIECRACGHTDVRYYVL